MTQHDMDIGNAAGATFRADLNQALAALVTLSSGASTPSPTYAYMWWADSGTGILKQRNAANTAFINVRPLGNASAFLALLSADALNHTGNGTQYTVICDNEIYDKNADYNPGTGVFTAPVTGRYLLCANVTMTGVTTAATLFRLSLITSNRTYNSDTQCSSSAQDVSAGLCMICDMDAGDTASFAVTVYGMGADTADVAAGSRTTFSGQLLELP